MIRIWTRDGACHDTDDLIIDQAKNVLSDPHGVFDITAGTVYADGDSAPNRMILIPAWLVTLVEEAPQ